jgi:hypothetical protein
VSSKQKAVGRKRKAESGKQMADHSEILKCFDSGGIKRQALAAHCLLPSAYCFLLTAHCSPLTV